MNDPIAKYRGIIYQSPSTWPMAGTRFIVIKLLQIEFGRQMIEIKLLDRTDFISSSRFLKPGHAKVKLKSIKGCTIIEDNRNIIEYLKAHLSLLE